ncbi:MAG: hypothetical protein IPP29_08605 [Bacteroidetes bacterium]|nr:hypothetical protein [Bacteroidota bacterium]
MKSIKKIIILFSFPLMAMSQQQDTTKVYNIQTITIGAEKFKTTSGNVPNYIVPISQADIQFQNNASSADLLQNKGGVFVQKSQGGEEALL